MRNVQSGMPRLIANLKRLKESEEIQQYLITDPADSRLFLDATNVEVSDASPAFKQLVNEVFEDLAEWMIADNGHHDIPNRETLNRYGYRFEKGIEDDLGVVTGILVMPDFLIEYKA